MKARNKKKKQKAKQRFCENRAHAALSKPRSEIVFWFRCLLNKTISGILKTWDIQTIACQKGKKKGKGFSQNNMQANSEQGDVSSFPMAQKSQNKSRTY